MEGNDKLKKWSVLKPCLLFSIHSSSYKKKKKNIRKDFDIWYHKSAKKGFCSWLMKFIVKFLMFLKRYLKFKISFEKSYDHFGQFHPKSYVSDNSIISFITTRAHFLEIEVTKQNNGFWYSL